MKSFLAFVIAVAGIANVQALVISEVMSNPTGTDNGREWIELYNETQNSVSLASLSVSTSESGSAVNLIPIQGGVTLAPGAYAIIGTIVSGQTKFLEDYPNYGGILLRVASTFSLTNGTASLYVRSGSSVVANIPSYTAADEGKTLSYIGGSYVAGSPTPGVENQAVTGSSNTTSTTTNATSTDTQATVTQMTPPTSDIVIYLPESVVVVAGAETTFSTFALSRSGKSIDNLQFAWSFGDGGQGNGTSTLYRYAYSGTYIAYVEAGNGNVLGTGRMIVKVVAPDITISSVGEGKYGSYIDVYNPNPYDIDVSQWKFVINGAGYLFPKHTTLLHQNTTRFSGTAMGFASTTLQNASIKIQFPNLEDVVHYIPPIQEAILVSTTTSPISFSPQVPTPSLIPRQKIIQKPQVLGVATTSQLRATSSQVRKPAKDTRLLSWIKNLFHAF